MSNVLRRLYDHALRAAAHKRATWWLAGVSFAESSFFPLPPDVLLIPMCVAARDKAFRFAAICTLASVLGGLLGYAIGYGLYETLGRKIIDFYGMSEGFSALQARYAEWGGWLIFAKGMTPIPYKIMTILSGVLQLNLATFIIASVFSRAIRFFLVAALIWKYGAPVQAFIEKRLTFVTLVFLFLLIGGFVAVKYIA